MLFRPIANPPNPWASTDVEYLDGDQPHAELHVYEDHSRTVLAKNDSPDVGFTYSVNPYRGCEHGCIYCVAPETLILYADMSWRPIGSVQIGDAIVGFDEYSAPVSTGKYCRSGGEAVRWS